MLFLLPAILAIPKENTVPNEVEARNEIFARYPGSQWRVLMPALQEGSPINDEVLNDLKQKLEGISKSTEGLPDLFLQVGFKKSLE